MKLLVFVVGDPENIEDVLSCLIELDVHGLVVAQTEAAVSLLAEEVPLFAGMRELVTNPRANNRVVIGRTDDDEILGKLKPMLANVGVKIDAPGAGCAMLIDIADMIGGMEL